jgi:hypothetical protein
MTDPADVPIIFLTRAAASLGDRDIVAEWDDVSGGTISSRKGNIYLNGFEKLSSFESLVRSFLMLMPVFRRDKTQELRPGAMEKIVVMGPAGLGGSKRYHIFQRRSAESREVHVFMPSSKKDSAAIEIMFTAVVPPDRVVSG